MVIACSLLAEERLAIAEASPDKAVRHAGAMRISFALCQEYTAALFMALQGFAGAHGWSCPSRTGQTSACPDRTGGPATKTVKNLPAQDPPTRGQMATHDDPLFIGHPQTFLP